VLPWIYVTDAAGHYGDGPAPGLKGGAMDDGVDSPRQAADDGDSGPGQVVRELVSDFASVGGGLTGADHSHRALVLGHEPAVDVQDRGQVVDLREPGRVVVVVPRYRTDAVVGQALELRVRVYGQLAGDDRPRRPLVQTGRPKLGEAGAPGHLQRAEELLEKLYAGLPNTRDSRERDPEFPLISFHTQLQF